MYIRLYTYEHLYIYTNILCINLLTLPISNLTGFMSLQGNFEEKFGSWCFSNTKAREVRDFSLSLLAKLPGQVCMLQQHALCRAANPCPELGG